MYVRFSNLKVEINSQNWVNNPIKMRDFFNGYINFGLNIKKLISKNRKILFLLVKLDIKKNQKEEKKKMKRDNGRNNDFLQKFEFMDKPNFWNLLPIKTTKKKIKIPKKKLPSFKEFLIMSQSNMNYYKTIQPRIAPMKSLSSPKFKSCFVGFKQLFPRNNKINRKCKISSVYINQKTNEYKIKSDKPNINKFVHFIVNIDFMNEYDDVPVKITFITDLFYNQVKQYYTRIINGHLYYEINNIDLPKNFQGICIIEFIGGRLKFPFRGLTLCRSYFHRTVNNKGIEW